jgi:hypothetical protein
MKNINTHVHEFELLKQTVPSMRYDGSMDFKEWQGKARQKLMELLGLPFEQVDSNVLIEYTVEFDEFTEIRFLFQSEKDYYVPCHLLIPKRVSLPAPLTLCCMGHGAGMHIALGRNKNEKDIKSLEEWPHRAMALRSIKEKRCALVMEPRNFGESSLQGYGTSCTESAKIAILNGRTALGGRVWDIMRLLDVVTEHFPQVDMNDIVCTGNSGGGTTTYYAACLDERIKIAAPSCSVCNFEDSIAAMPHCMCNYVPGIRKYFEMGDMAGMIAPRRLIVAAGMQDSIFPIFGVKKAFQDIKRVYAAAGCEENCSLVIGDSGHYNYADLIWEEINRMSS